MKVAPHQSIFVSRRTSGSFSTFWMTTNATTASGTQIQKVHRQDMLSTMNPPSSGPVTVETPKTAPM